MTEHFDQSAEWDNPRSDETEALVRAAGGYVRPSETLRPRLLDAARAESRERWAQQKMWQVALVVALWGALSTASGNRWQAASPFSAALLQAEVQERPVEVGAAGWSVVDSFTDLRRRQAAVLSLSR
jgi:hypothetical protein